MTTEKHVHVEQQNGTSLAQAVEPVPQPPAQNDLIEREAISAAFIAGAEAVHAEWVRAYEAGEEPPRGDPEFGEAASDYASAALSQREGK